jgi:YVTN family beta-propeller protein
MCILKFRAGPAALALLFAACGGAGPGPDGAGPPSPDDPAGDPAEVSFVNWEVPPVHPLALDAAANRLLLAHTPDHRLEVFDTSTGVPVHAGSVAVGLSPVSVRWRTANEAWVVNHTSDSISVVDLAGLRVTATIQTDDEPCDVVFAGTPQRAFVTCSQVNRVQVFDPMAPGAPVATIPIAGEDPRALAVSPDGATVYAAIFESGNGSTILGGGLDEAGVLAGGGSFPPNGVSAPTGPHLGVNPPPNAGAGFNPAPNPANPAPPPVALIVRKDAGGTWLDDTGADWTGLVSGLGAPLSGRPFGWDLPDRDLARIDVATFGVTYARRLMNVCMDVAVNPATGEAAVVGTDGTNEVRFESVLRGRFLRVNLARVDGLDPGVVTVSDLNPHLTYAVASVPPATRALSLGDPRAIVFDGAGTHAYVAGMGSNNVVRIDAAGARAQPATVDVGAGPCALALDTGAGRLFVWNRFGGSISVVDVGAWSEVERVAIYDPTPAAVRDGRRHLYDTHATSGLGHVACASCHVDARMDRLAWDLGAPDGEMKTIAEQNCGLGGVLPCPDFHPQKGPMTTQTLQDIIGHEPHHWRGDRRGLEEFGQAFPGLLGADAAPTPAEMQAFEDFLATIAFPPNPFRNLDNSLPTALPLPGQFETGRFGPPGAPLPDGNAERGLLLYRTAGLDGSVPGVQLDCVTCHTLPTGLGPDRALAVNVLAPEQSTYSAPLPAGPNGERHLALVSVDGTTNVTMKVPQLRNLHEKVGFDCTQTENDAGFGFLHDGSIDSLARFVSEPVFGPQSTRDVADLVAFLMAFSGSDLPQGTTQGFSEPPGPPSLDTHAAVGAQVGLAGGAPPARVGEMIALADAGAVDLVVKGRAADENRGWVYDRSSGTFVPDRDAEPPLTAGVLQALAAPGAEQTWTVVPLGLGVRLGIDRDEDGFGDRSEVDAGSDPTSLASTP